MRARVQIVSLLAVLLASGHGWADDPAAKAPAPLAIHIGDGYQLVKDRDALYALIEKTEQGWRVKAVDKTLPNLTNPETQEILIFSRNLSIVEPAFGEYMKSWKAVKAPDFICRSGDKGKRPAYNPCESSLTEERGAALTAIANIITLGGATLDGGGLRSMLKVKSDAVRVALESSGALEAVRLHVYRDEFDQATTAANLRTFMKRYADADPEGLVPKARERLDQIMKDAGAMAEMPPTPCSEKLRHHFDRLFNGREWPARGDTSAEDKAWFLARELSKGEPDSVRIRQEEIAERTSRESMAAKSALWNFVAQSNGRARAYAWLKFICAASVPTPQLYEAASYSATNCKAVNVDAGDAALIQCFRQKTDERAEMVRLSRYRADFEAAATSYDFAAFIDTYRQNDPDTLVPIAEKKRAEALKSEKLALAAKKKEEAQAQAKLATWRKSLRVGDDTFCGPIVELRAPMVKIAITVQLQGYANETWMRIADLYPNWMAGCRNVNGNLSPVF